jgi:four helix bundle protein
MDTGTTFASAPLRMAVDRFEDLDVWQTARAFCQQIGPLLRQPTVRADFALWQQLNSAAISTLANIAEGFLRNTRREFSRYLRIAAGSNGEARALLYVAHDRGYLTDGEFQSLIDSTNAIGRMLRALEHAQSR